MANTLAYLDTATITAVKSVIVLPPEAEEKDIFCSKLACLPKPMKVYKFTMLLRNLLISNK